MSGSLEVVPLAAAGAGFAAAWDALVEAHGDVYYRRDYLAVAQLNEAAPVLLALFRGDAGAVLYPVVRRPLAALDLPAALTHGRCDLVTPYEYGGPLLVADQADDARLRVQFESMFDAWCRDHGVVAEFARFHPLLATHRRWESSYRTRLGAGNIVIDLTLDDDTLLAGMRGTTRRAIQAAERRGLRVVRLEPRSACDFGTLYRGNMDRLAARQEYYFSDAYFRGLAALSPTAELFAAEAEDGRIAGVAAFLAGPRMAHYHLSAADREMSRLNPLNAIIFRAARTFRARGCTVLHLGGAAANQPGLRAFKQGFSDARCDYVVGTRIRDAGAYDRLCRAAGASSVSFFPAYRATALAA